MKEKLKYANGNLPLFEVEREKMIEEMTQIVQIHL